MDTFNYNNWKKQISIFLTAQNISLFGSSLVQYAIIWYITLVSKSGVMLTISTLCAFLPQMLISIFGGVWADKYNRKSIIMIADSVIAFITLILAILFANGIQGMWILFVVLACRSFATGVQVPAVNSFIPQLVPTEKLMRVNSINSSLSSIIMILSPAVGGAVLSFAPLETALMIDIITAIIGVGLTATIKYQHEIKAEVKSNIEEIKNGILYLKTNRQVLSLLIFQLMVFFLASPIAFLTPILMGRVFGFEIWRLSVCEITFSLGAVLGGIFISIWGGFKNRIYTTLLATVAYALIMFLLAVSSYFYLFILFNIFAGMAMPYYNTPIVVFIQENVPKNMQGRVFSFMQISTSAALPFGMLVFGPMADIFPIGNLFIFCGVALLIISYVFFHKKHFA